MDRLERLYFRLMVVIIAVIAAVCIAVVIFCELDGEQTVGMLSASGLALCLFPMLPNHRH